MIPSVILRKIISQIYTVNIEAYAWSKEFQKRVFKIKFKDMSRSFTLGDVYMNGCNIGNCLHTSCIIQSKMQSLLIVVGKVEILKGTKNSAQGDHVWLEDDDNIYDPTLMIVVPKESHIASYYTKEYNISSMLGQADFSYCDEFYLLEKDSNLYYSKLFKVEQNKKIGSN